MELKHAEQKKRCFFSGYSDFACCCTDRRGRGNDVRTSEGADRGRTRGGGMNLKHLDMAVRQKICPVCSAGMTQEISPRIYRCRRVRCGETFDFSQLTDAMLRELLKKKGKKKKKPE